MPALIPAGPDNPTPIHIHVHHEAIRVAYDTVLKLIPKLLPPINTMTPPPDIILHIGLAAGRTFYTLENGAHGRGYGAIPDVDGLKFLDDEAEKRFPKSIFPSTLSTTFSTSDVLARWKTNLNQPASSTTEGEKSDVRLSPDAGNFLCGFIYWNSLAHYFAMDENERPVAFMHVPDLSGSDNQLAVGREVAIALIKALVESRRKVGVTEMDNVNVAARRADGMEPKAEMDVNFT